MAELPSGHLGAPRIGGRAGNRTAELRKRLGAPPTPGTRKEPLDLTGVSEEGLSVGKTAEPRQGAAAGTLDLEVGQIALKLFTDL